MTLTWAHPQLLVTIAILAVAAAVVLQRTRRHSRRWRMVCVVLPALAAACLIASLAQPMLQTAPAAREVVVLLDLSGSTRTSPWRSPAWVRAFVHERTPPGTRITAVGFARTAKTLLQNVSLSDASAWPPTWPEMEEDASDLPAAIRWRTSAEDRRPRWVFTDGLLDFASLDAPQFQIALTVASPGKADAGIVDFQLREPPGADAARIGPELQLTVRSTGQARTTVEVRRAGTLVASRLVTFAGPATQIVTVRDPAPLPESPLQYEAILAGHSDPWPENDRAALLTPPRGAPATLVVSPSETPLLTSKGQITRIEPKAFPTRLADLLAYQIIVLDDLPAAALSAAGIESLDHFVRDTGGGLLILGRGRAFGPGGYLGTVLEELSPLASVPPERPPLHVVFLLDASGSMKEDVAGSRKFSYVASGVGQASRVLRPADRITAVVFGDRIAKIAEGTKEATAETLASALRAITPSGPTNPDNTLSQIESGLDENTRVVLLTDGEIPHMDVARWAALLSGTKAKLTLVAPRDPSTRTLAELAKATSATWLATDDATAWPRLLRQAIEEPQIGKTRDTATTWRIVGGRDASTSQWIETWLKPDARGLTEAPGIAGPAGKPLAGIARRGLGQVAAASFVDASAQYSNLLESVYREISPPAGDRRFGAVVSRGYGGWRVELRGRDAGAFLNGEKLRGRIITQDGRTVSVDLPQTGPGQYAAELPETMDAFTLVITRDTPGGAAMVARVTPAALAGTEWPASGYAREVPAGGDVRRFDVDSEAPGIWRVREKGTPRDPRGVLLVVAGGLLVAALYLRRGGR